MNEEWRDIPGYEGYYKVSNLGKVKSLQRIVICRGKGFLTNEKILSLCINKYGYYQVVLCKNGKKNKVIHQLVLSAFSTNPENKPCVNHKDGNKLNNNINNLEYVTVGENNLHKFRVLKLPGNGTGKFGIKNARSRPIIQLTKAGIIIKEYDAILEASRETGVSYSGIYAVCKGEYKNSGGFLWRFKC